MNTAAVPQGVHRHVAGGGIGVGFSTNSATRRVPRSAQPRSHQRGAGPGAMYDGRGLGGRQPDRHIYQPSRAAPSLNLDGGSSQQLRAGDGDRPQKDPFSSSPTFAHDMSYGRSQPWNRGPTARWEDAIIRLSRLRAAGRSTPSRCAWLVTIVTDEADSSRRSTVPAGGAARALESRRNLGRRRRGTAATGGCRHRRRDDHVEVTHAPSIADTNDEGGSTSPH